MQAVVMAGGEGTRLRPLTLTRPKPLVPVCNKPIMEHIINLLQRQNFKEIYATLHYLADEIVSAFGDGSGLGVKMKYSVEDIPLGTAGSVGQLRDSLKGTFLIISGDALCDFDLAKAIKFHKEKGSIATLVLTQVKNPLEFGVVITDEDGSITRFMEKPSWGEVFSDTVNTGIYILDEKVFEYIEKDRQVDFSKDVFPRILEDGKPLYGYVAGGYWCDIGNLKQYLQAQFDVLQKKVDVQLEGKLLKEDVMAGEGTRVDPKAKIIPPVFIGKNCQIKGKVYLDGYVVLGDNVILEDGAQISHSVIGNNVYVGEHTEVMGSVVGSSSVIKSRVVIADGVVIGDNCRIESGAQIRPSVKIWPEKYIEQGGTVSMSLIWGTKWPGSLFTERGVRGLTNRDITPDFATKLGSAFGASFEKGSRVIASRDNHPASRMIKRATISGIMSVGTHVRDLRLTPAPVARHEVKTTGAQGGVHIRVDPENPEYLLLEFYDNRGMNVSKAFERKVENIFFREDFRRVTSSDVGILDYGTRALEFFTTSFLQEVDTKSVATKSFKVVVDYAFSPLSMVLPPLLGKMKCETVALNAYLGELPGYRTQQEREKALHQLSTIVSTLHADLGVLFDAEGERFVLVDDRGHIISNQELLFLYTHLVWKHYKGACICVPLTVSMAIERQASSLHGKLCRTKTDLRFIMEECVKNKSFLACDEYGGFIFPSFHPSTDAVFAFAKLLELLSKDGRKLSAIYKNLPRVYLHHERVSCPWEQKASVMRKLTTLARGKKVEHLDGIKIYDTRSWVLIRPDTFDNCFWVYAEGTSREGAKVMVEEYASKIREMQQ